VRIPGKQACAESSQFGMSWRLVQRAELSLHQQTTVVRILGAGLGNRCTAAA